MTALIREPGVYEVSEEDYHADPVIEPSFSNSIGKILLRATPRHAWHAHPRLNPDHAPREEAKFDTGKAAHSLLLRDERAFAVIEADDWRTKAAKEAREAARAEGKLPLLAKHWAGVTAMAAAARAQLAEHEVADVAFVNGAPERTLVWREGETWCRCRLDWKPDAGRIFLDYKSTEASAKPESWARHQLYTLGFDFQCALYRRAIRAVLGIRDPAFEFVVQECAPPYALSVVGVPPSAIDLADRMVDEALELWRWCLAEDRWPGYPNRTIYQEPPAWYEARWLEYEAGKALVREKAGDKALFEMMMQWQAPLRGMAE